LTSPTYTPPTEGFDARETLRLLRRRGWIMLVCLILIPLAAYELTASRPKVFEASTLLQVAGAADTTGVGTDFGPASSTNIQAIAGFVRTTAVSEEAARQLHVPPGSIAGGVSAVADEDTGFITINATAPTAAKASAIANAYAAALNATRAKRGTERVNQAITQTEQQLKQTPKGDLATRTQLGEQLQKLQTLRAAQSQNVQVLQRAEGAAQIAPHPKRNATVAILLALLVGSGLILLSERADRRLRDPDDLEDLTGLPFLATVPHEAFAGQGDNREVDEAFQTLRNTLTYFNADEPLKSIVVTSGLKGEGKTTVAVNLALAYAAFGKRVVLVDTDLRKPDVGRRLGLSEPTGLSDVLAGNTSLEDAFQEVGRYGHGLRVLPAGPIPPNPSALLGSLRMAALINELTDDADIVVLDSTPLLMVSDAFPLLDKVSGVVGLARLDQTPRDAIRRMVHIMSSAGARALGLVATDAKHSRLTGHGYSYGYGYGYGADRRTAGEPDAGVQS
jgi:capsular exopolysaccharide synthesis family protein